MLLGLLTIPPVFSLIDDAVLVVIDTAAEDGTAAPTVSAPSALLFFFGKLPKPPIEDAVGVVPGPVLRAELSTVVVVLFAGLLPPDPYWLPSPPRPRAIDGAHPQSQPALLPAVDVEARGERPRMAPPARRRWL